MAAALARALGSRSLALVYRKVALKNSVRSVESMRMTSFNCNVGSSSFSSMLSFAKKGVNVGFLPNSAGLSIPQTCFNCNVGSSSFSSMLPVAKKGVRVGFLPNSAGLSIPQGVNGHQLIMGRTFQTSEGKPSALRRYMRNAMEAVSNYSSRFAKRVYTKLFDNLANTVAISILGAAAWLLNYAWKALSEDPIVVIPVEDQPTEASSAKHPLPQEEKELTKDPAKLESPGNVDESVACPMKVDESAPCSKNPPQFQFRQMTRIRLMCQM